MILQDFFTEIDKKRYNLIKDIKGEYCLMSSEKMSEFEILTSQILKCRICKERLGFEPTPILMGKQNSKIVQISQAPSKNVHATLKPFNDATGKKLKYQWYEITDEEFYDENNFYIAAMAHCYPGKNKSGGDKLPPKICAQTWLDREMKLLDNEIFILIGRVAAKHFFPQENYNDLIFKDNIINGKKTFVLPHPSPLNIKWFKDHPDFYINRLPQVREVVKQVIDKGENE